MKKQKSKKEQVKDHNYRKIMKISGISGILVFISIILISISFALMSNVLSVVGTFSLIVSYTYFLYGFSYIGKIKKNKLLQVSVKIFIIVNLAFFIFMTIGSNSLDRKFESFNKTIGENNISFDENMFNNNPEISQMFISSFMPYIGAIIIYFFIYIIFVILFNIAIMRLDDVKYAKNTGIVGLISIGLLISIIGVSLAIPLAIANCILLIVILFEESKVVKTKKQKRKK